MAEARTLQIAVQFKDELTRPLSKTERALSRFGELGKRSFSFLTGQVLNLRNAVIGLFAAYSIKGVADRADAMRKLAQSTGDTTENISELAAVFAANNVDGGKFEAVLRALTKAQGNALRGSSELRASFQQLGISVEDLASLGPSQLFEKIALGLERFGTAQEKLAVLGRILPKNALDVSPTLSNGLKKLQEQIERVRRLGATVFPEQADAADAWGDSIDEVAVALGGVARQVIVAFGPTVTALLQRVAENIADNRDTIVGLARAIGTFLVRAIDQAVTAIIGMVRLIESIPGVSLVDNDKLKREAATLRNFLGFVTRLRQIEAEEALNIERRAAGKPTNSFRREMDSQGRIFDPQGTIDPLPRSSVELLREREGEMRKQLAAIESTLSKGLADVLQTSKNELVRSLAETREAIEQGIAGGDQKNGPATAADVSAAAAVAATKAWEAYQAQVVFSLTQTPAAAVVAARAWQSYAAAYKDAIDKSKTMTVEAGGKISSVLQSTTADQNTLAAALDNLNQEYDDLKGQNAAEVPNTFTAGLKKRFEELTASAKNFARTAGEAFADVTLSGLDGISDALANVITGTMSAKEAFRAFAKQFLLDIARMISKMLVLGTIKTIFGLETGGVVPGGVESTVPIGRFAKGGIARSPQLAVFGEGRTAEAFVPLPDNRSIPVTFTGGGAGGTQVSVSIYAMDSRDVARALNENSGVLRTIWTGQTEHFRGMRQTIQRAAS